MCLPVKPYKVEREWQHAGLLCAVVLAREGGHRCGYVRVPPNHPAHGQGYDSVDVSVHGGLTFAQVEPCAHDDGTGWWFGFDCAHSGDASYDPENLPEHEVKFRAKYPELRHDGFHEHYWLQSEVEHETEHLAEQLASGRS
jgi:hypothetical protein